jgi:hypothetical protein
MEQMVRLDRILRRLVATAYPELKRLRIAIAFAPLADDTLLRYDCADGRFSISVGDLLREAPIRVLEGGIAHELAHLVRDSALAPRLLARAYGRYDRSRFYRARDERATDRLAIERGLGPQLLAFLVYARSRGYRFTPEHGLHTREIAALCARSRTAA